MTEFNIEDKVDEMLKDRPDDLRKVKDNRKFIKYIKENKVKDEKADVPVFGVKSVNVNAILKDNIHDHVIFTIDKLCRMYRSMRLEKLKKYQRKKRNVPINAIWVIIILFGVIMAVLIVLFLLPQLGVM
jgi:hypothetical protein